MANSELHPRKDPIMLEADHDSSGLERVAGKSTPECVNRGKEVVDNPHPTGGATGIWIQPAIRFLDDILPCV